MSSPPAHALAKPTPSVALTQGHTQGFLSPEATVAALLSLLDKMRSSCAVSQSVLARFFYSIPGNFFRALGLEELGFHMVRVTSQRVT